MSNSLVWKEESRRTVFTCPIFSVGERYSRSPEGNLRTFSVLDARDWAMIIPALETERGREFVMVRQWRHGAQEMSLEFPAGVLEKDEDAEKAAARELKEETGYSAGKIEKLGCFNPNPAIMSNKIHFFLARDLKEPVKQNLDPDEFVEVEIVPWEKVLRGMGEPPYIHALAGTALLLFLQKEASERQEFKLP